MRIIGMVDRTISFNTLCKWLNVSIIFILMSGGIAWCGAMSVDGVDEPFTANEELATPKPKLKEGGDYSKIGLGALKVHQKKTTFPLPDLKSEILFLGSNTRSDLSESDHTMLFGLQKSKEVQVATIGEKVYLGYQEGNLLFANRVTPLWIEPFQMASGEVKVRLNIELRHQNKELILSEQDVFSVKEARLFEKQSFDRLRSEEYIRAITEMNRAKWWSPDRLYDSYGGNEYREYIGRERLEFDLGIHYVKEGDVLVWKEGVWSLAKDEETKGSIIATTHLVTPHKLEVTLWDPSGFDREILYLSKQQVGAVNFRIEEVFTRIKKRTVDRISCRISNKSVVLKKGDWILHTDYGWKVLKTWNELSQYLEYELRGGLFIFDGIEKGEDKDFFVGSLFDDMRTQMQRIKFPINIKQKSKRSLKKKNKNLSKIQDLNKGLDSRMYQMNSVRDIEINEV